MTLAEAEARLRAEIAERREALDAAAAELVDREGPDGLTLAALADALGVRSPSLYNHVDGLPDLLAALRLQGIRELGHSLARATVGKTGPEAVRSLAKAYRVFIHTHPGVYPLTIRSVYQHGDSDPALATASREVVEIVLAALAGYGFDQDESLHVVRGLRSLGLPYNVRDFTADDYRVAQRMKQAITDLRDALAAEGNELPLEGA